MKLKGNCLFYAICWRLRKRGSKLRYSLPNWRKEEWWGHWSVILPSGRYVSFWNPDDLGPLKQLWFEGQIKIWGSKSK